MNLKELYQDPNFKFEFFEPNYWHIQPDKGLTFWPPHYSVFARSLTIKAPPDILKTGFPTDYNSVTNSYGITVVSSGFPKFFNLGEREVDHISLDSYIKSTGSVLYSKKYDGTLIIRFVENGKVYFRTRGFPFSLGFSKENQDELYNLVDQFSDLLDPKFYPGASLLFEYVSPNNRHIISYKEPELIYLGYIVNRYLNYINPGSDPISTRLKHAKYDSVEVDSVPELQPFVDLFDSEFGEGIVLNAGGRLIKVKTNSYYEAYRASNNLRFPELVSNCINLGIFENSEESFRELITFLHVDYEISTTIKSKFDKYTSIVEEFFKELNDSILFYKFYKEQLKLQDYQIELHQFIVSQNRTVPKYVLPLQKENYGYLTLKLTRLLAVQYPKSSNEHAILYQKIQEFIGARI